MLQNWHSSKHLYTKLKVVGIGYIEWWHVQLLCHARKGIKTLFNRYNYFSHVFSQILHLVTLKLIIVQL